VLALAPALGEARTLRQGSSVDLGEPGFRPQLLRGWSVDERWFERESWVWARSERAELELLLGPEDLEGERFLEFRCVPFRFEGAPHQTVGISVNGRPLGRLELPDHTSVQRVRLPASELRAGRNRLRFVFGHASPPPDDPGSRALSVAFDYVRLLPLEGSADAVATPAPPRAPEADAQDLRQPPGTAVVYPLRLPERARLSFGLRLERPAPEREPPPVEVHLRVDGRPEERLLRARPDARGTERALSVDLGEHAGRRAELALVVGTAEDSEATVVWTRPVLRGALPAAPRPRRLDPEALRALRKAPAADWNLLLISVDTLRPDHLSAYGYARETSPHLDALAADGVLFLSAIAQAPSTLPSHASLLTSLVPAHHGASLKAERALPDGVTTLAEVLRERGYATVAFHGGGQVAAEFGLAQGFDTYQAVEGRFAQTVAAARGWLEASAGRPFFLFLHTYETHAPYRPELRHLDLFDDGYAGDLPDWIGLEEHLMPINGFAGPRRALGPADLAHVVDVYDAGIRSMDEALGELVAFLRETGLYERTLIVLTSDHGEELGERGFVGWHAHTLFDELLRVPLVVKLPGSALAGARVARQVRSLDIAPSVLDVLRIPAPEPFEGISLFDPRAAGDAVSELAWSQTEPGARAPAATSLRTSRWKLYGSRLYDLRADPGERTDVARRRSQLARRLSARRDEIAAEAAAPAARTAGLSEATRERLRELGYVE
jgi:arylsulfatase A-like enzyme